MIKGCNCWQSETTSCRGSWDLRFGLFNKKCFGNSVSQEPVKLFRVMAIVSIFNKRHCKAKHGWCRWELRDTRDVRREGRDLGVNHKIDFHEHNCVGWIVAAGVTAGPFGNACSPGTRMVDPTSVWRSASCSTSTYIWCIVKPTPTDPREPMTKVRFLSCC